MQLVDVSLADSRKATMKTKEGLSLLIGSDYYWLVVTGKQQKISTGLRAVETIFGWTVQGTLRSGKKVASNSHSCFLFVCSTALQPAHSSCDPTVFWSLETIGIRAEEVENEQPVNDLIQKCIAKTGQRYVASLP